MGYGEATVPAEADAVCFSGWSQRDDNELWHVLGWTAPAVPSASNLNALEADIATAMRYP
jgi:hypothetical protein